MGNSTAGGGQRTAPGPETCEPEKSMSVERFEFGDQVRHTTKPEWGIGTIVKAENSAVGGKLGQRLSIRFPGVGVKVLDASAAPLERVEQTAAPSTNGEPNHAVRAWGHLTESDWLGPLAQRKIEQAMIELPEEVRDRFNGLRHRLTFMLSLYRFDRTAHSLVDWAVAQTGLDDPLSRFNRHELEQFFDRWAFERDAHLGRLMREAGGNQRLLESVLAEALPAAKKAAKRFIAVS